MSDAVVLDSSPLGMICNPNKNASAKAVQSWVDALLKAGRRVLVPEIADYEVRREFVRIQSLVSLSLLNNLELQLEYLPLTTEAMRLAADLWAQARNSGKQTAHNHALDGDVIIAAQALVLGKPFVIATGNPTHLSRFAPADLWQNIVP